MEYKTNPIITRYPEIILSYKDVPYSSALTFNAAAIKRKGQYIMLFRNDYGSFDEQRLDGTNIGLAYSNDGIKWKVEPKPVFSLNTGKYRRVYDPRLTVIDDEIYLCFAVDSLYGVSGGIAKVNDDFTKFDIISISVPDNRNMVLFPEKINDRYVRLERPMPVYGVPQRPNGTFDIWMSYSKDLVYWGDSKVVLSCEDVKFCNNKIGPAAPPIKTEKGWLTLFHSVDLDATRGKNGWEDIWQKRYCVGIMLLDLENPSKVIGISKEPLMVPETKYETEGCFRNNVVFPCAMIKEDNGIVRIYYGAGDTYIMMATARISDLINACCDRV